ncbi:MAG: hypothetical protein KKC37_04450 [Proteobacteria bacterium]|nr:hypothetical protein [Pseudomonadota bacterium]
MRTRRSMRPLWTFFGLVMLAALFLIPATPAAAVIGAEPDQASTAPILLAQGPASPGPYRPSHPPDDPAYHGPGAGGKNPDGHGAGGHNPDGHGAGGHNPAGHRRDLSVPGRDTTGVVSYPASPASPASPAGPAGYQGPDPGVRSTRQDPGIRSHRLAPGIRSTRFDPNIRSFRAPEEIRRFRYDPYTDFFLLNPELGGSPLSSTTDIYLMNPDLRPD